MRRHITAAVLGVSILVLWAAPGGVAAGAAPDRPWAGHSTGQTWFDVTNPKGCDAGITTRVDQPAMATHFGNAFLVMSHCPTGVLSDNFADSEFTLIGANGDAVFGTYVGWLDGYDEVLGDQFFGTLTITITGGSGRFEGASGSAVMEIHSIFEGYDDLSWAWWAAWRGSLSY